jgi:heme oxygenase
MALRSALSVLGAAMSKTTRSELNDKLRQAAKAPHRLVDRRPLLASLLRYDLTEGQYGDALAALHCVYAQLEAGIDEFLRIQPELFDYHTRRKLPSLNDDLAELGRLPCESEMRYPAPATVGELVGVLYTVEGSAMGGQSIAHRLRQGGFDRLPMRFFSGHGEHAVGRWHEFSAFADASCPAASHESAALTVASLFDAIKKHLDVRQPFD